MLWVNFEKWSYAARRLFVWDRVYWNGYKWTPFIYGTPRILKKWQMQ